MTNRISRRAIACALFTTTALASPAFGATPLYRNWDENGVDVVQGDFRLNFEEAAIGSGKARLALVRNDTSAFPFDWDNRRLIQNTVGGVTTVSAAKADKSYFRFTNGVTDAGDGSILNQSFDPDSGSFGYEITDSAGVKYLYSNPIASEAGPSSFCDNNVETGCDLTLRRITKPDGTVLNVAVATWRNTTTGFYWTRVASVTNNFGYSLKFAYQSGGGLGLGNGSGPSDPPVTWTTKASTALRRSGVTQATVSYAYPASGTVDITDPAGHVWELTGTSIKKPGDVTPSFVVTASGTITSVANAGVTTSYSRTVNGNIVTLTKTDPLGNQTVINSDLTISRPTSFKDPLPNRTTGYQYDAFGRLTKITRPEGDGVDYVLDARGNATQIKQRPKTGSASPLLITTQTFPGTCTNPLTCNQPTKVSDPANNATDYTYDPTHGGVLTITSPAPTTGAFRPQTRYGYTAVSGVFLPTGVSACQTLASCTGTADEVKITIGYDAFANPTSVIRGRGDGTLTATSAMTYDAKGDVLTTDGPLPGSADTTGYRYDAVRRMNGVTSPDPDGAGPLKPRATRTTFDDAGRATKQERGNVDSQSDADWALFSAAETLDVGLDANGRPVTQKLSGSAGAVALTQTSYDAAGRPQCSATRMNPAVYASLPVDACTLGTAGSFGPDRIAKTVYDAAGQVMQQQVAVGTADAATERTLTYSNDGDLQTLRDAEANLTTYEYDEYDRLAKTRFPLSTKGSNASSATDYELLGYDTRSNVTSRQVRDGQLIAFTYDALNRPTLKNLPGTEPDVTYAYDLLGRLISANQTGNALLFTYDALSRNLTQVGPQGTVTSAWDLAGRRTQLTYPGAGLFVNSDYLVTGETTAIRENGAVSGVGVLATYAYDNLGRRSSTTFGNGVVQASTYDPVSRLASLTNDLASTPNDLAQTFAYNPASQIASQVRTGDAYAWTGHFNENSTGTPNGLNQLTAVGAKSLTHDSKGNVTAFGTKAFTYSSENLLATGPNSTSLAYDPLLRLYQTVSGSTTARLAYDGPDRIAEYDGSNALLRRYVHGPGTDEPIVWYEGSATSDRRFLSRDERHSIVSVTNSAGTVLGLNRYDDYGRPHSSNIGAFGYTGQAWLPTLGLWYYKARVNEPELGRFLQTDPIDVEGGVNLYAYVDNDPVNRIDPFGLCNDIPKDDAQGTDSGGAGGGGADCPSDTNVGEVIVITGKRVAVAVESSATYSSQMALYGLRMIPFSYSVTYTVLQNSSPLKKKKIALPRPPKPPHPLDLTASTLDQRARADERWIREQADAMQNRTNHYLEIGWHVLEHFVQIIGGH